MAFLGQLKLNGDPFARNGIAPMGPVRAAFEQLMRHVELGTAIILVVGPGGSGKTFLLDIAEESCRTRGISVLRIERGDLAHTVIGKHVDLLLVDEADFVDQATLNFIAGHPETAKTVVFACRTPCSVGDMATPTLVNLTPLTASEARDFLVERATAAGRPDLFAPDALDSLVAGTSGLPRLLRSVGALALFLAAHEGAGRVCMEHVADALDAQSGKGGLPDEKGSAKPRTANFPVSPVARMAAEPAIAREPTPLMAAAPGIALINSPHAHITTPGDKPESPHGRFTGTKILGAALLPLLLLSGSLGQADTATQVSATMERVHQASAMNAMRGLERVADVEYSGPIVLVVLNPPALQPLQIAQAERTFAAVKKPVTPALPSKKTRAKNPPRANITQR
jgi:hypothetical protein